jgi:hypothetical protein
MAVGRPVVNVLITIGSCLEGEFYEWSVGYSEMRWLKVKE